MSPFLSSSPSSSHFLTPTPFTVAMVVPTGIGASVGGYAGDATSAMRLLASVSDILITHPNVANAAIFQHLPENALYVEGYALDQWCRGHWALRPVRQNPIGVVWDAGIPPAMRTIQENTLAATAQVYGLNIVGSETTPQPVEVTYGLAPSGASYGTVAHPQTLTHAAQILIEQGAHAIATVVYFPPTDEAEALATDAAYEQGQAVDTIGGLEGVISHAMVSKLKLPCAHAPVFAWEEACPVMDRTIHPRAAAEYIAPTFLPSVLQGLNKAPQYIPLEDAATTHQHPNLPQDVLPAYWSALVVPANALGGIPVLAALERKIPVIAVQENKTALSVDVQALLGDSTPKAPVYHVASYLEAAGLLQAMRCGIGLESLNVSSCQRFSTVLTSVL